MSVTDISVYDRYLQDARSTAESTKSILELKLAQVNIASTALSILSSIDTNADRLDKAAEGLTAVMKIVSKVGPLKALAKPLQQVLDAVENRAEEVHNSSEKLESKFKPLQDALKVEKAALNVLIATLDESIDQIDSVDTGIADAQLALSATELHLPAIFGTTISEAAGTVQPVIAAAAAIEERIELVKSRLAIFAPALDGIEALGGALTEMFNQVNQIVGSLDFLEGPLRAVQAAVKPIEWALDAIDLVFDLVVSPVLNPILDALGVSALMDSVTDAVRSLLPDISLFAPLEAKLNEIKAAIGALLAALNAALDNFTDATIGTALLGPLNGAPTNGSEIVAGDDDNVNGSPGTALNALGGNDIATGGLGDDTVRGGDGNDILIGGEGDDLFDGGAGTDVAILLGNFSEFQFKVGVQADGASSDNSTLIFTHSGAPASRALQGVESVRNVEYIAFLNVTFAFADFLNAKKSGSTPSMPATLIGTPARDVLLGDRGVDTIYGRGRNDYIQGGGESDSLYGEDGDDLIDGGPGIDAIGGGLGEDTVTYENEFPLGTFGTIFIDLLSSAPRRIATPHESLRGVESLIGHIGADWFWGSNVANKLSGGANKDWLNGFGGNDILDGGSGRDYLVGWSGNDIVRGGDDHDVFIAGPGNDRYEGGSRTSTANFSQDLIYYGGGPNGVYNPNFDSDTPTIGQDPGLAMLGFLPTDFVTQFPARVVVDQAKGIVRKFDATGLLIGVDVLVGVPRVIGSRGGDLMIGSNVPEGRMIGAAGNDTIRGGSGIMDGGLGNDDFNPDGTSPLVAIFGGDGNDIVHIDDDTLISYNGDQGVDTLDLSRSNREWRIGQSATGAEGHFAGDIDPNTFDYRDKLPMDLFNVENFIGSRFNDLIFGTSSVNVIGGGPGNDAVFAGSNGSGQPADRVFGGDGDDQVAASTGDDILDGGNGNDRLVGGDPFNGVGGGVDTMRGQDGDDRFVIEEGGVYRMFGGAGIDTVEYSGFQNGVVANLAQRYSGPSHIGNSFDRIENMRGSGYGDHLTGSANANKLTGESGDDTLDGAQGADILYGNDGFDILNGGAGNDVLLPGRGDGQLNGGGGIDTASFDHFQVGDDPNGAPDWRPSGFDGAVTADLARGLATFLVDGVRYSNFMTGIENLFGGYLNDILLGNLLANTLTGGDLNGADQLFGYDGNDTLTGGGGGDLLDGGAGNDMMVGGAGEDTLHGSDGNDVLRAGVDNDVVSGGIGSDTAIYTDAIAALVINLTLTGAQNTRGAGTDTLSEIENVTGSRFADWLIGGDFRNALSGGGGGDRLSGRAGNDVLAGGAGSDVLAGGLGNDRMAGGEGGDSFVFDLPAFGADTITDFTDGADKLSFRRAVADAFADFVIVGNGTADLTVSVLGKPGQSIALHGAAPVTLTAGDFVFL